MTSVQWSQQYLMVPNISPLPGLYSLEHTPMLYGVLAAMDDPTVGEVVVQKSSQIGYTTMLFAYLGRRICLAPCPIIILFPGADSARDFVDEKLDPFIASTPELRARITISTRAMEGSRAFFRSFPGGFLKLGGARSIGKLKSATAGIVVVEEPDDAAANLKAQGDTVQMLYQRVKRWKHGKRILGGTPSVRGLSRVEAHIATSDCCELPIRCHRCDHAAVLDPDNLVWKDGGASHPIYGSIDLDSARYRCPSCNALWNEDERRANVQRTVADALQRNDPFCGWVPTKPFHGTRGFRGLNDLYSCLPGAGMANLLRERLTAQYNQRNGDLNAMIVYTNQVLGLSYDPATSVSADTTDTELVTKDTVHGPLNYPELQIPAGGYIVSGGMDVQHKRLSIVLRAWGIGMESWLLLWDEYHAAPTVFDIGDRAWAAAEKTLFQSFASVDGWSTGLSALTVDTGDGHTTETVYAWLRAMKAKYPGVRLMAGKGSSMGRGDPEIFSLPRPIDQQAQQTYARKYGLGIHMIGTGRAKDWIHAHLSMQGTGPGRFHWYSNVRADYLAQLFSEAKLLDPLRKKLRWQLPPTVPGEPNARNEALDCEVYALHAAYSLRLPSYTAAQWERVRLKVSQLELGLGDTQSADDEHPESLRELAARLNT